MMLRGEETDLRMAAKAHRILAEAAAVLDEQWKDDGCSSSEGTPGQQFCQIAG